MEFGRQWLKEAILRHEVWKDGHPTGTIKIGNAIALVDQADFDEEDKKETKEYQKSLDNKRSF